MSQSRGQRQQQDHHCRPTCPVCSYERLLNCLMDCWWGPEVIHIYTELRSQLQRFFSSLVEKEEAQVSSLSQLCRFNSSLLVTFQLNTLCLLYIKKWCSRSDCVSKQLAVTGQIYCSCPWRRFFWMLSLLVRTGWWAAGGWRLDAASLSVHSTLTASLSVTM